MYKRIAFVLTMLLGIAAVPAHAQQAPAAPQLGPGSSASRSASDLFGLSSQQVVAIAVGAVAGVVVLDVLVGAPNVVGAVAGGLIGNWYFNQEIAGKPMATRTAALAGGSSSAVGLAGDTLIEGVQLANVTFAQGADQAQALFGRLSGFVQK
jgi:hypothetical protein